MHCSVHSAHGLTVVCPSKSRAFLETKRTDAWKAFDEAAREIDRQKDALLDEISRRLEQTVEQAALFTLRWQVV